MEDVTRLLAYEEIRQLVARYAFAIDTRDLETLVGLFVPDVRVTGGHIGRDELGKEFDRQLRSIGRSVLNVGTHVIELGDTDHATGWVYTKAEIESAGRWIHQSILYEDTYERRWPDGWLFVRRVHRLWYGAEPGVNPLNLPLANWPERHDGLGTVPEHFATWRAFWT